jgi:CRP/FNR family transcriptional regulator
VRPFDTAPSLSLWRIREDATLLREGPATQTLHVVRSGSLKCLKTLEDGYEQVLSLAQPGDLLGFEALHCGRQPVTAVALEDTTAYALSTRELPGLRAHCPVLHDALQLALSRQLLRAAETTEMMAAVASDVRLARFLLWMSSRMAELGQSPRRLRLRMCRRDIASLLGVAHETVSRSFGTLAEAGFLKVDNREVELLDIARLQARARITRGPDDHGHAERHPSATRTAPTSMAWCPDALGQAAITLGPAGPR